MRYFARIAVYTMIALMYAVLFGFVGLTFAYSCFYDGARTARVASAAEAQRLAPGS